MFCITGCVGPMISDTIDLGISLLRGGNIDVQKVGYTCIYTLVYVLITVDQCSRMGRSHDISSERSKILMYRG